MAARQTPLLACLLVPAIACSPASADGDRGADSSDGEPASLDVFCGDYGAGDATSDAVVTFTHRRGAPTR